MFISLNGYTTECFAMICSDCFNCMNDLISCSFKSAKTKGTLIGRTEKEEGCVGGGGGVAGLMG